MYNYRNYPLNKLNFNYYDVGGYIGRLFYDYVSIRQFMEETLYQAIFGGPEDVNELVQAAVSGMFYLNSVVRSPETSGFDDQDEDRYSVAVSKGEDGSTGYTVVEKRNLMDRLLLQGRGEGRLSVRGVEFDKIIAMIMLTQRNIGCRSIIRHNCGCLFLSLRKCSFLTIKKNKKTH